MATDLQNLTQVILCNAPIDSTYQNQLDFTDRTQQRDYFNGLGLHRYGGLTYQRKDRYIEIPSDVDSLWGVNYVMYQNANFGEKWFYAFITRMEYLNPETTRVYIDTDAWQTWQFDVSFGNCYVEREHTSVSNSISVDEGLDYGNEYVLRKQTHLWDSAGANYVVCMTETVMDIMKSKWWDKTAPSAMGRAPQAVHYYAFDDNFKNILACPATTEELAILNNPPTYTKPTDLKDGWLTDSLQASNVLDALIVNYDPGSQAPGGYYTAKATYDSTLETVMDRAARLASAIIEIFRIPFDGTEHYYDDEYHCHRLYAGIPELEGGSASSGITADYFAEPKLNTFPYSFFKLTNHKGSEQKYKPEYVSNPHISYVSGFGSPVTVRFWCDNYQGSGVQKDKSVISNTNNSVPVLNDRYGAYLMNSKTQNDVAVANSVLGGISSAGVGFALGGPVGALVGGMVGTGVSVLQQISSQNAKKEDIRDQPPTVAGGANNGNFELNDESDGVWVELWTINDQHGAILSDYFNRFGYRINRVKVPNFKGRANFNFIKTVDCIVTGGVPMEDLSQIKNMFNTGVTIWHNPWNVGSY